MTTNESMTIGKISKATDIGIETIRNYERQGLIPPPKRSSSGYRLYPKSSIQRLRFINQSKSLGFSLSDIGEILSLSSTSNTSCGEVQEHIQTKIKDIDKRIERLLRIKQALEKLENQCNENPSSEECPILKLLQEYES
jgi:MerR family copper efflux transcriptional regulator